MTHTVVVSHLSLCFSRQDAQELFAARLDERAACKYRRLADHLLAKALFLTHCPSPVARAGHLSVSLSTTSGFLTLKQVPFFSETMPESIIADRRVGRTTS